MLLLWGYSVLGISIIELASHIVNVFFERILAVLLMKNTVSMTLLQETAKCTYLGVFDEPIGSMHRVFGFSKRVDEGIIKRRATKDNRDLLLADDPLLLGRLSLLRINIHRCCILLLLNLLNIGTLERHNTVGIDASLDLDNRVVLGCRGGFDCRPRNPRVNGTSEGPLVCV